MPESALAWLSSTDDRESISSGAMASLAGQSFDIEPDVRNVDDVESNPWSQMDDAVDIDSNANSSKDDDRQSNTELSELNIE